MANDPDRWPELYSVLVDDPDFGKELVLDDALGPFRPVPKLSVDHLADLYMWLVTHFPLEEDRIRREVTALGPRDMLGQWRDSILHAIRDAATVQGLHALRRIIAAFPQHPWLRTTEAQAEEVLRRVEWTPVHPIHLIRLASSRSARLLTSWQDLQAVILEALERIQRRLTGETPESHLLWDTRSQRPKTEDELSDYMRNKLEDEMGGRAIAINREVQIRRGRPSGIGERVDIEVEAAAVEPERTGIPPLLTIPVEVKQAWNSEVLTSMESQLVNRYMNDINTSYGIYVVGWCDVDDWWSTEDPNRQRATIRTKDELVAELNAQAAVFEETGKFVRPMVLDYSYSRPVD